MTDATNTRSQFDFTEWEDLVEELPAGLQLWMAGDLAARAGVSMARFKNPRFRAAFDLSDNANSFRLAIKADRAERAAKEAGEVGSAAPPRTI